MFEVFLSYIYTYIAKRKYTRGKKARINVSAEGSAFVRIDEGLIARGVGDSGQIFIIRAGGDSWENRRYPKIYS